MRTLLSIWSDGLAPLSESLVSNDAANCTNTSSVLDVHVQACIWQKSDDIDIAGRQVRNRGNTILQR